MKPGIPDPKSVQKHLAIDHVPIDAAKQLITSDSDASGTSPTRRRGREGWPGLSRWSDRSLVGAGRNRRPITGSATGVSTQSC